MSRFKKLIRKKKHRNKQYYTQEARACEKEERVRERIVKIATTTFLIFVWFFSIFENAAPLKIWGFLDVDDDDDDANSKISTGVLAKNG